jgi:hypothetical protein
MQGFLVLSALLASTTPISLSTLAPDGASLKCTAAAIDTGGPLTNPIAQHLEIVVERWSTEPERHQLLASLGEGQKTILETVRELHPVGYIKTPASLGWDLHFAQSSPGEDGGSRVIVATDRPMSFWEVRDQPKTFDYPFTFAQLQLNKDGDGKGTLSVATRVVATSDGKYVDLESYDTGIQLNDVRCR